MPTAQQKSIFLFYGDDTYSSSQKVKIWGKEFVKKHGDINFEIIEGKTFNTTDFVTNMEAIPFLSEKRLIIIKGLLSKIKADDQKRIAKSLEKTPDFCILVFHEEQAPDKRTALFKKISKLGKVEEFKKMSPYEFQKWTLNRAKKENININQQNANFLNQHCGYELWTVSNELEKLKLFTNNKEVTKEIIESIVTPSLSASIFKLTDSLAEKNAKASLKTLEILQDSGEELNMIFFMIVRHFRILIQVSDMISKGNPQNSIQKKLKQHPFVIQKTSSQSKNFTMELLEKIYKKLLQIDIEIKTGIIKSYQADKTELKLTIEKLIVECCNK